MRCCWISRRPHSSWHGLQEQEIQNALGRTLAIRYKKSAEGAPAFRDPVSEVDHAVEALIRARLAEPFPSMGSSARRSRRRDRPHDFLWAIDPIDGTTNFINGFPLFAASIGILHRGQPDVGAIWCSTSHALTRRRLPRPGWRRAPLRGRAAGAQALTSRCGAISPGSPGRARVSAFLGHAQDRFGGNRMCLRRRRASPGLALRAAEHLGRRRRCGAGAGDGWRGAHKGPTRLDPATNDSWSRR